MVVSIGNLGGAIAPFLYSLGDLQHEQEYISDPVNTTGMNGKDLKMAKGSDFSGERRGHFVNGMVGFSACVLILILQQYLKRKSERVDVGKCANKLKGEAV